MIAFQTPLEPREEISYQLQLLQHPQGVHVINGMSYRPEWTRSTDCDEEGLPEAMIEIGSDLIIDHITESGEYPRGAEVKANLRGDVIEANIIGGQNDRHI